MKIGQDDKTSNNVTNKNSEKPLKKVNSTNEGKIQLKTPAPLSNFSKVVLG